MIDTKQLDVTNRCQNCGGLKKEHGKRAPFRCSTRLTESNFLPWTVEGYEQAEKASAEQAAAREAACIAARTCPFCNLIHKAIVPTVHTNGTDPWDLILPMNEALARLREAWALLMKTAPNGRDYYPQGDSVVHAVTSTYERHCGELDRMIAELQEQRDHVEAVIEFQIERKESQFKREAR